MSSIQTGGYNTDLFVSEVDEIFKCPTCHDVVRNPVELACQHIYCGSCITQVLKNNSRCPECRTVVKKSTNGDWIYDQPRRYFRNMHSSFRLKCDLEGCEHITTIEAYQTHQTKCEFNPNRPVQCQKCKAEMCSFELNDHDCFRYLLTKVNVMEAASGKLELALATAVAGLQSTQTSAQITINEFELKIRELEKSAKADKDRLEMRIQVLEDTVLLSINRIRESDNAERTLIVKQSDTIQNVCDQFSNQLGDGDKFVRVGCDNLISWLDLHTTVKDCGIESEYSLAFSDSDSGYHDRSHFFD